MNTSERLNELAAAMAAFQAAMPTLEKSKKVTVRMKSGSSYSYDYTPLDYIMEAVKKPLADNGLSVMQMLDEEGLTTIVMHHSGQFISSTVPLMRASDIKDLGGQITYMRRYALSAALGIVTSDDVDGGLTENEDLLSVTPQRKQPTKKAQVDTRGDRTPQSQAQRDPRNKQANKNGNVDWKAKALKAKSYSAFASAAAYALSEYDNDHHIKQVLEDQDSFEYDPANNEELLEWLAARKEAG